MSNVGKVEKGIRKTPHQQVMSKLDRRNQARQRQQMKQQSRMQNVSIFSGQNGAPRHVAVVPICPDIDVPSAVRSMNQSVDVSGDSYDGATRVRVDRFRQNVLYMPARYDLTSALDVCRVADFIVIVLSSEIEVEQEGELLLKSIEGQGISNVIAVVQVIPSSSSGSSSVSMHPNDDCQGLDKVNPAKKRPQVASSLKSFANHFFPSVEKVLSLDSRQEASNAIRTICTAAPRGIRWRDERSWMVIENVEWPDSADETIDNVTMTGVVRGKGLKADRIVHIPGWGDFQVNSITAAPLPAKNNNNNNKREDSMNIDSDEIPTLLDIPTADRDDLETISPEEIEVEDEEASVPDPGERKGVLLDDYHYFSEEEDKVKPRRPKRLPRGTSDYQAAWYLDDVSDSGSDLEDEDEVEAMEMDTTGAPEDGVFPDRGDAMTEAGPSEYPQSEMFIDPPPEDEAQQLEEYRASRRKEASEDLEFPDEIELHPNVIARERLARYRGLKNFKSSVWETAEDRTHEPEDWRRLLQFADYRGSKNKAFREALVGGANTGTHVNLHLQAVPAALRGRPPPFALFSLLRHEHKHTVINANVTLTSEIEEPLKSKEEIIVQCGPRRLVVNPIFSSSDITPNNVHKFERFLHPGRSAVASWIGPLTWGSVPVLLFKRNKREDVIMDAARASTDDAEYGLELIGTGTLVAPDQSRVVSKRVILTGHPFKINKKVVTIRYMFFNAEDVNWFKALQLWTKRGRSGHIKESLGTHGYYKAMFDGRLNPQDTVGISLYKRVFPREARALETIS